MFHWVSWSTGQDVSLWSTTNSVEIQLHGDGSLVSFMVTRSRISDTYWVRILLGRNFSGSASGVSDHAQSLIVGDPGGSPLNELTQPTGC